MPNSPLVQHLGMRLEAIEDGRAELVLPFRPELATMDDIVHGGAIASLIDTAGMAATWSDDSEPESLAGSTVTLNVNYVAAARGQDLTATARGRQARAEHGVQRGPRDRAGRARRRHRLGRPAAGVRG